MYFIKADYFYNYNKVEKDNNLFSSIRQTSETLIGKDKSSKADLADGS